MSKEQKFEEKISELEKIINELETGKIDLDESIKKYTEAMKLVKECDDKLKNVEEQVNKMISSSGIEEDFEITE